MKLAVVTKEIMIKWATQWPDLYKRELESFRSKYPIDAFRHKVRMNRSGYVLLIAQAR